jgi:serine/threonine protein kinase
MGVVYRALDRARGIDVALKMVRRDDGKSLYRFKREFRSLADAVHPNLVTLYDLHTEGDAWFYTMELVEGASFIEHVRPYRTEAITHDDGRPAPSPSADAETVDAEMLKPTGAWRPVPEHRRRVVEGRLDLDLLRNALGQLVDGVYAMHRFGKIHRDLKPSNVLVDTDGRVVILDFGLTADKAGSELEYTHKASAVGTPMYMSPEQAADVSLSEASDWYSVGVMLFEALTGRRPFEGRRVAELYVAKQSEDPLPAGQLAPGIPDELSALCTSLLRREPRERPKGREILTVLGRAPSKASIQLRAGMDQPFVGRRSELAALESAYAASREGPVCVFVQGNSGIGKSMLVRRFLGDVPYHDGAVVLRGRCFERELVPHKALDSVVDALTRALLDLPTADVVAMTPRDIGALTKLFPVVKRVDALRRPRLIATPPDPQEMRRRAFGALRYLLTKLAERAHMVIHIDDLQWGDIDSVGFLRDLMIREDMPPLLFVATYRREEQRDSALLQALNVAAGDAHDGRVREIALEGFDAGEAQELVDAVRPGSAAEARIERLVGETGGSPLFLAELVRRVADAEAETNASDDGPDGEPSGEYTLERLLRERIRGLNEDERRLLEVVAVAGQPISPRVLVTAAQLDGEGRALAVLRREHLVRSRGSSGDADELVEAYHDQIRHVVVASLDDQTRRDVHRRLALALALTRDADPARLVEHWIGAGEHSRAGDAALRAATAAEETLAFHRAADFYAIALEHKEMDEDEQRSLWGMSGHALTFAGRLDAAASAFATAARNAPPEEVLEYGRLELEQVLRRGHLERGMERTAEIMSQVGGSLPRSKFSAILSILVNRARLKMTGLRYRERAREDVPSERVRRLDVEWSVASALAFVSPVKGRALQMQFMREALRSGVLEYVAQAFCLELGYLGMGGVKHRARCERLREEALAIVTRAEDEQLLGSLHVAAGITSFLFGRWTESYERLTNGERHLRDHAGNARWEIDIAQVFQAGTLAYLGRFREMARLIPIYVREAEERGDVYASRGLQAWRGNVLWLALDQPDEAERRIDAVTIGDSGEFHLHHYYEWLSRTRIDLYRQDIDAAGARVEDTWKDLVGSQLLRLQTIRIEAWFLRGRCSAARAARLPDGRERTDLIRAASTAAANLERTKAPWGVAMSQVLRAALAELEGKPSDCVRALRATITQFDDLDMTAFAAAARYKCGKRLGGTDGDDMIERAESQLAGEEVVDMASFSELLVPVS